MLSNISLRNLYHFKDSSIDFKKITIFTGQYDTKISTLLNVLLSLRRAELDNISKRLYNQLCSNNLIIDNTKPLQFSFKHDSEKRFIRLINNGIISDFDTDDDFPLFDNRFCYIGPDRLAHLSYTNNLCVPNGQMSIIDTVGRCEAIPYYIKYYELEDRINEIFPAIIGDKQYIGVCRQVQDGITTYRIFGYSKSLYSINKQDTKTILKPNLTFDLSSGELAVLPIIAAFTTPDFKFIIISSPELGLHPSSQSALTTIMQKLIKDDDNVQLILITQSDHIFNSLRVCVKQRKLDSKDVIIHHTTNFKELKPFHQINILPSGEFSNYPDGFMDQWESDLMKLI